MGRAARDRPVSRGAEDRRTGLRRNPEERWDLKDCGPEPYIETIDDDQPGPVDDEYIWPVFEENDDD